MALLPSNIFQPPLPAIPFSPLPTSIQWIIRLFLFVFTLLSFPVLLIVVPLSIILPARIAILPLHPHNLPPHCSYYQACRKGWWAYIASGFLWAITSTGTPPDHGIGVSRWLAGRGLRKAESVARETQSVGNGGTLEITEVTIPPLPLQLCVGALGRDDLPRRSIHAFWLHSNSSLSTTEYKVKGQKAILWLAGGGYVTGYPLNDRPIFSLARNLPLGQYRILAPSISRALSLERSFPLPVLDALAAYSHLRSSGYMAEEITVIGNSAGGGLAWSLLSYLVALDDACIGALGVPRSVMMISPWLRLPPASPGLFPDFVNTPQLLNAARCYLARYPTPYDRQSSGRLNPATAWLCRGMGRVSDTIGGRQIPSRSLSELAKRSSNDTLSTFTEEPKPHLDWFDDSIFNNLSVHHPLISPSAEISSPFVRRTLELLTSHRTKLSIHCGTAEWFYLPIIELASAAKESGVDVSLVENEGGLHSEACLSWPERGGPAAILQQQMLDACGVRAVQNGSVSTAVVSGSRSSSDIVHV